MQRIALIFAVSLSFNSCTILEPDRQEMVNDLKSSFEERESAILNLKSYLLEQKQKRGVDVKLEIAERLEKVQLYEWRMIDGKKEGYVIINDIEKSVTTRFFRFFKSSNIGQAFTRNNSVKVRLLKSPSYEYDIYYVWTSGDESSFEWCSLMDNQWSVCGLKVH